VFHLFDSPLRLSRPYESYMGCLTVPARVAEAAENASVLLDYRTPRRQVAEAIEAAYPGIRREHIHVWTLRGKSRVRRLGRLWEEWERLSVHLVEDGWKAPSGLEVFTDSGTYAPTFLVGNWRDEAAASNMPLDKRVLQADDFLPEKNWHVLASAGYMCDDPYTGAPGVTQVADNVYRVTTRLTTRKASSRITFTLRLMESFETTRQVF